MKELVYASRRVNQKYARKSRVCILKSRNMHASINVQVNMHKFLFLRDPSNLALVTEVTSQDDETLHILKRR